MAPPRENEKLVAIANRQWYHSSMTFPEGRTNIPIDPEFTDWTLCGFWGGSTGYSNHATLMKKALGWPIANLDPEILDVADLEIREELKNPFYANSLLYIAPVHKVREIILNYRNLALFSMHESDRIPDAWLGRLAGYDLVLVPSEFCMNSFAQVGPVKVPLPYDNNIFRPAHRKPNKPVKFLAIGRMSKRKGFDILIDAWSDAFSDKEKYDDVRLHIHLHAGIEKNVRRYLVEESRADPRFSVSTTNLSQRGIYDMMREHHCLVSTTRGEGFGLVPLEALGTDMSLIAPIHSGHEEFLNEKNCYPVEWDYATPDLKLYADGNWFEPKVDSVARQMRKVYDEFPQALRRAQNCHQTVKKFRIKNVAEKLQQVLSEI